MANAEANLDTSTTLQTISTLRRRRGNVIGHITSFNKCLDQLSLSEPDLDMLQISLESLTDYWTRFDSIQSDLEDLCVDEVPRRFDIQNSYHIAVARARKILREAKQQTSATTTETIRSPSTTTVSPVQIRLPEIRLPTFDGSYENWNSFYDQFSSVIDRNDDLTSAQKLQYLRSTLKGKAAACIQSLATTDSNYADAIETLKNKFDCTRRILRRHFDAIREFPKLTRDTSEALGELVDLINQQLRALKNLGQPISSWDTPLICIILSKLNTETIWHWELTLTDNNMPSYIHLVAFLEKRANCAPIESSKPRSTSHDKIKPNFIKKQTFVARVQACPICQEAHGIWGCDKFKSLSVDERINAANKKSLCQNCLGLGHNIQDCHSISCRVCQKRHHTLLHKTGHNSKNNSSLQSSSSATNKTSATTDKQEKHSAFVVDAATNELLVTAQIDVLNDKKELLQGRTLIDTGATTNFMTESFAKALGLPMEKCHIPVGALNALNTVSRYTVTAVIRSRVSEYERKLTFLTIPQISSSIPDQPIDRSNIRIPGNLKLADPSFHQPAAIDMLLGSGTALSLLCIGQINLTSPGGPDLYVQKTKLGWVIGGCAPVTSMSPPRVYHSTSSLPDLAKFWELEDGPRITDLSEEDAACEEHFKTNTTRDNDGRYVVALPFNSKEQQLGESRSRALKRFLSLERKLGQHPDLKQQYHSIIEEYFTLGHLTLSLEDETNHEGYFLPYHGVTKKSSLTTKLRIVFDASAETSTGISLNDTLFTGPKLQDNFIYILLRFRIHRYVLTGDIEKMYRQFLVRPDDRKYQQILWRDTDGVIKSYSLNTVTFGLTAAPYLAIKCLHQLAEDEAHRFPRAANVLKRDFYVDDALTGVNTIDEGIVLREELKQLLRTAGLHVRQWASNDSRLLDNLPQEDINKQLQLGESTTLKTLGIFWNSETDTIHYAVHTTTFPKRISKRYICSEIAKIYDPLGLLGPIIVTAKMLLQRIWSLKIDWDESLPADIHSAWIDYYKQLPLLNNISFPRHILNNSPKEIQLHGFCDASLKAYGACIYIRSTTADGQASTELLIAKSKVAPLKQHTIPRLELCGALLLSSLITTVQKALDLDFSRVVLWTDSTIVLHWLHTSPNLLKTFVGNRVAEIQRNTELSDWRHVRTTDNPADLISRGVTPEEFLRPSHWHTGPEWLTSEETNWPTQHFTPTGEAPEQRKQTCLTVNTTNKDPYTKYSSWTKLQKTIAYCLRWRSDNHNKGPISVPELHKAQLAILKHVQQVHFPEEIRCLTGGSTINSGSKLLRLNPFLDKDGVLRVGGRLQNSRMGFSQKHPAILPNSHVTNIIIEHEHRMQLHSGVQATLYALRLKYWPTKGRSQVSQVIRTCCTCCRHRPPPVDYIMGNLPGARVTESRPFTHVGVDYCGPFYIKERRHRNRTKVKVYVAVYVCLAVKAVHLELVSDMTTDGFIGSLRRFIARRGHCSDIYSDNGSNFIGADNELRDLAELLRQDDHNEQVQHFLAIRSITWHFIPPQAPHFGGLWEAAVKSFKYHLRRVAGTELFTFENFNTLIIEIESVLNSRPLTPLSSDPQDLTVLTPGHFLIGDPITSLRERNFTDTPKNRLSSWQHVQQLKTHFWARWHREYLNELTQRNKWSQGNHPIIEGSMVLIREDNTPPLHWALGRVIQVHPGSDDIVRTATIRTASGTLKRSVKKLVPLPTTRDNEEDITLIK